MVTTSSLSPNESSVSYAAALDLAQVCMAQGVFTAAQIHAMGIAIECDAHLDMPRIPESTFIHLWQALASEKGEEGIGLTVGTRINAQAKGVLASWVSQSQHLREAMDIFTRNIALMNPSEHWQISQDDRYTSLTLTLNPAAQYPTSAIERSLSAAVTWASALSGKAINVHKACFTFSTPSYQSAYHPIFGDTVLFEQASNCLVIDNTVFDLPVISHNALLKNFMEEKAQHALAEIYPLNSISDKVTAIINKAIHQEQPLTIHDCATQLAMSRQTLYRHLKNENTSFQILSDTLKKNKAQTLIASGLQASAISESLGFKDTSSFYKAFKRWFGVSPSEVKKSDS